MTTAPPPPPARPSPPGSSVPTGPGTPDPDLLAAGSPATTAAELARIAASRPDLHAILAANPATYPELVDWLRASSDPAVQIALVQRAVPQAPPAPLALTPAPSAGYAPALKRARTPRPVVITVVVLVTVLVLSAAAAGIWFFFKTPDPIIAVPSASWAKGARQTWTMDAGGKSVLLGNEDQLFVANTDSDQNVTRVTAYDVSGNKPKEQWTTKLNPTPYASTNIYWGGYWGGFIIANDKLIDADDGETTSVPWGEAWIRAGTYIIGCSSGDRCTGWSAKNPDKELWRTTIPGSYDYLTTDPQITRSVYQGDDSTIALVASDTGVNATTGDTYDFGEGEFPRVLADGWYTYINSKVTILSPTGEKRETFTSGEDPYYYCGTWRPTTEQRSMTAAQLKSCVQDDDFSWAQVQGMRKNKPTGDCWDSLKIGDSTLKPYDESGRCAESDGTIYSLSSDGSVLLRGSVIPVNTGTGLQISGAWTVEDGDLIHFPGNEFSDEKTSFYLVNPELIVAIDEYYMITAYKPAKK